MISVHYSLRGSACFPKPEFFESGSLLDRRAKIFYEVSEVIPKDNGTGRFHLYVLVQIAPITKRRLDRNSKIPFAKRRMKRPHTKKQEKRMARLGPVPGLIRR